MPAITKPNLHFDATTYTGTGSALSVTNGGFQPDFVWMKSRTSGGSAYTNHTVIDSVRGAGTYGYKKLKEVLLNPKHPEYKSTKIWVGAKFDPTYFDMNSTQRNLKNLAKLIQVYEEGF